jgi:hypothetical protein
MVVDAIFFFEKKDVFVIWVDQEHSDFVLGLVLLDVLIVLVILPVHNVLLLVFQMLDSVSNIVKLELE